MLREPVYDVVLDTRQAYDTTTAITVVLVAMACASIVGTHNMSAWVLLTMAAAVSMVHTIVWTRVVYRLEVHERKRLRKVRWDRLRGWTYS